LKALLACKNCQKAPITCKNWPDDLTQIVVLACESGQKLPLRSVPGLGISITFNFEQILDRRKLVTNEMSAKLFPD
jgi:hypothetical protein